MLRRSVPHGRVIHAFRQSDGGFDRLHLDHGLAFVLSVRDDFARGNIDDASSGTADQIVDLRGREAQEDVLEHDALCQSASGLGVCLNRGRVRLSRVEVPFLGGRSVARFALDRSWRCRRLVRLWEPFDLEFLFLLGGCRYFVRRTVNGEPLLDLANAEVEQEVVRVLS